MTSSRTPHVMFGVTSVGSLGFYEPVADDMTDRGWRVCAVGGPISRFDAKLRFPTLNITDLEMSRAITPWADTRSLTAWVRLLRRERPDVVIGATPKASLLSMTAARLANVPLRIFNAWGARWDGMTGTRASLLRRLDQVAAASATEVISVSDSLADLFVREGVTRTRPTVLGRGASTGVDVKEFRPRPELVDPMRLVYAGRLSQDKGIADLITVFERCRAVHPTCRLTVMGSPDAVQPIDPATTARLHQPGIELLGARSDIAELLPQCGVLVFPSIREGLPNVVIEAAASGVPTVGYRATGVVDAVEPGVTGLLVPLGDVSALTTATLALMGTPEADRMRESSRGFATAHFARDEVVRTFNDHVEGLLRVRRC